MNNDYLIHYGVLGMKWGIRRYQYEDGTRTPLGKRRERLETTGGSGRGLDDSYSNATLNTIKKRSTVSNPYDRPNAPGKGLDDSYSDRALSTLNNKSFAIKKGLDDDYSNETLSSMKRKGLDDNYSNETLSAIKKTGLDDKYSDDWLKVLNNAGINNVTTPRQLQEKVKNTNQTGKEYVSKALENNKVQSNNNTNNNKNNNNNNNSRNLDFENKMGNINDVYRIANATSSVFKQAKNLQQINNSNTISNNRVREKYSARKLKNMSDEDLEKAINRVQRENTYLSASNKYVGKGKEKSGELLDKLATIASIAGTGIAIYGAVSSIKNRNRNG